MDEPHLHGSERLASNDKDIPDWLLWFARHPLLAILGLTLLFAGIPSLVVLSLDRGQRGGGGNPRTFAEPTPAVPGRLPLRVVSGQRIYVPIYSHVYTGEGRRMLLAGTLGIRNTDDRHSLTISAIDYFDTRGERVRSELSEPLVLPPLGTHDVFVPRSDDTGGAGANFIVEWVADEPTTAPIVEAVMVAREGSGLAAFVRPGVVVEEVGTRAADGVSPSTMGTE